MMENKIKFGIRKKLYLFTVGLFLIVLSIMFVVQNYTLKYYYYGSKEKLMEKHIDNFEKDFSGSYGDKVKESEIINKYYKNYDVPVVVFEVEGDHYGLYSGVVFESQIFIKNENDEIETVVVTGFETNLIDKVKNGDVVEIQGFNYNEENKYYAQDIKINGEDVEKETMTYSRAISNSLVVPAEVVKSENDENNTDKDEIEIEEGVPAQQIEMTKVENIEVKDVIGTVVGFDFTTYELGYDKRANMTYENLYSHEVKNFVDNLNNKNEHLKINIDLDETNYSIVYKLVTIEEKRYMIGSAILFQDMDEAIGIFNGYYSLNILLALIIASISVTIFSKLVTNPILKIETAAKKISNKEFDVSLNIDSKDELESLGNIIVEMGKNIEEYMADIEVKNKRLIKDNELLNDQIEIRKNFLMNASHELKTPLTIVKGIVEGVEDGVYDGSDRETYKSISEETHKMQSIVNSLLGIVQNESYNPELKLEVVSLNEVFYKQYYRFKSQIQKNRLTINISEEECYIRADENLLKTVISNLLSNAIKYAKEESQINIRLNAQSGKVMFSVDNEFVGKITSLDLENIWDPFYKIDDSGSKSKGGTGLGLALVKSMMETLNYRYGVNTNNNRIEFFFETKEIKNI